MKILHVCLFLSVRQGGGTADLVQKVAKAQSECGHEVSIYAGDYGYDPSRLHGLQGVSVSVFRSWLNSGFYIMPDLVASTRRQLRTFDVIHLHCYRSFQNLVVCHYARRFGVPYVLSAHGSVRRYNRKIGIKCLYDWIFGFRMLQGAARLISDTEHGIDEYRALAVGNERVIVVRLPVSTEEFSVLPRRGLLRERFGIRETHIVLFLGRIHWTKGLDFLVQSFYELTRIRNDVFLVIVGPDDGYKGEMVRLIESLHLSAKVLFTGFLAGDEKLSALVDADVVVQPSRHEHAAWACLEAVLCETPVVVTRNTGAGEEIGEMEAGYLAEFGNLGELTSILLRVIEDPTEGKERARKAGEYIRTHRSMMKQIKQLERVYQACIEERKSLSERSW